MKSLPIQHFLTGGNRVTRKLPYILAFVLFPFSGTYSFLNLNLFNEFESNPFIQSKRFTNINFGYKQRISIAALLDIPDSYLVDVLPKPVTLVTPDQNIRYQRYISFENGKLIQNNIIEVNTGIIDMNQYLTVKEFYKRMISYLNEPIVLKKTNLRYRAKEHYGSFSIKLHFFYNLKPKPQL